MSKRLQEGYLKWRCRRGTKELDVVLNRFLDNQYDQLTDDELIVFDDILNTQDTELWYWLSGKTQPDADSFRIIISKITQKN